jgi:hypothetical protein
METATASGGSLITMLVTFLLIAIPIAILNSSIARRKGKSGAAYAWLSVLPLVGYFLAIYLISLTDRAVVEKLDRIAERLDEMHGGADAARGVGSAAVSEERARPV